MGKYIVITFAALLICLSCCTGTDGDGNDYDQTTVLGTLHLFQDVWNDGDLDAYKGLLDEENFTFYFDPQDVDYGLPFSWGYVEEAAAYTGLFDTVGAGNISVWLDLSGVTEPEGGAETYQVQAISYLVRVVIGKDMYEAEGRLDMQLEKIDGDWVITKWWDRASFLLLGITETSWGAIKAEF